MGQVISWAEVSSQIKKSPKYLNSNGSHSKMVFTNGCFDILHVGHVRYLKEARSLGDLLVVGLNSDSSVKKLKGPTRPVQSESDRAEVLSSLGCVDFVILFDQDTPLALIQHLQPDVLVKGGDWPVEKIVGHQDVLSRGGLVKSLKFYPGHSTTSILEKIQKL